MAELLVRVADKVNDDFYLNCQCTKRGDVIVVCPDGWGWGREELSLPCYRIVKLPQVAIPVASTLLGREFDTDPTRPSRTLQRRAFRLELAHPLLPAAFLAYVADDTRAATTFTLHTVTEQQLLSLKVAKARILDPGVLG